MEKRNCLTCKYEPDWEDWKEHGKYRACVGSCKWNKPLPKLPAVYRIPYAQSITRYGDDSGIHTKCDTWEGKVN